MASTVSRKETLSTTNGTEKPQSEPAEDSCYGLRWEEEVFGPTPVWTVTPDTAILNQLCRDLAADYLTPRELIDVQVDAIAQGTFNRIYSVKAKSRSSSTPAEQAETGVTSHTTEHLFICRISLPINPYFKTLSEHATLACLGKNTSIPVARVLAYSPYNDKRNSLRFEWMLQTYMPGMPLVTMWQRLGDTGQQHVVRQLAGFQIELFNMQQHGIGSLYVSGSETEDQAYNVHRIVTLPFCMRNRAHLHGASRGPFRSSEDWLGAQLDIIQLECELELEKIALSRQGKVQTKNVAEKTPETLIPMFQGNCAVEDNHVKEEGDGGLEQSRHDKNENGEDEESDSDEDYQEDLQARSKLIDRLLLSLPKFFPETDDSQVERSILSHPDLRQENILVDEHGTITAVLDWENSACLPIWVACDIPYLLNKAPWHSLPNPKHYIGGEEDDLYKERLEGYQLIGLRQTFLSYMEAECPSWIEIYEKSGPLRDLFRAVDFCDSELAFSAIERWLTALEENDFSLERDKYVVLDL